MEKRYIIRSRLSDQEIAQVREAAERDHRAISEWVRLAVLEKLRRDRWKASTGAPMLTHEEWVAMKLRD